ncbi:MAG: Rab family GTPase [Promethearchaeota archaeon]
MVTRKEFVFKLAVIGSYATGKTSLINRYVDQTFKEDYKPTLGASIIAKEVQLASPDGEVEYLIRLVLWDIAGQEKYESVRSMYFQGCQGAILVYDITRVPTFREIESKWLDDFRTHASPNANFILIGNKTDLENLRNVSTEEGRALAEKIKASAFVETSAKTGENVSFVFERIVRDILRKQGHPA